MQNQTHLKFHKRPVIPKAACQLESVRLDKVSADAIDQNSQRNELTLLQAIKRHGTRNPEDGVNSRGGYGVPGSEKANAVKLARARCHLQIK